MPASRSRTASAPEPTTSRRLPGLLVTGAGVVVASLVALMVPSLSALTAAVVVGLVVGNLPFLPEATRPGLAWATRRLLRCGVVLLGLQLAVPQVLALGTGTLLAVLSLVAITFLGTLALGQLLGLSRGLSVLVATGSSICGASAIAAVEGVVDRKDEDVATAVAIVTVFGSLSMLAIPLIGDVAGWSGVETGRIAGGAVHEVAQVVAAASPAGSAAVGVAVVVKLSRVVLLAPMVAAIGLVQRRRTAPQDASPPIVPLFVVGFLVAVLVRSTGFVPESFLDVAKEATTVLLAGALFGLGTAVRWSALRLTGLRAFALGAASTVLVTVTAVAGMLLLA